MNSREKWAELEESKEHEKRMNMIGQNGNDGLHYVQTTTGGVEFKFWGQEDLITTKDDKDQLKIDFT